MPSFTCASCNQLHDGLPELAVPEPYFVGCLDPVAKANVERLGTELCVFRDGEVRHFFVRGALRIPICGSKETWSYAAWLSLSPQSFAGLADVAEGTKPSGSFFGWFESGLPGWPETVNLKSTLHVSTNQRPFIELEPTDHPLAVAQREGLPLKRILGLVDSVLHPKRE